MCRMRRKTLRDWNNLIKNVFAGAVKMRIEHNALIKLYTV